MECQSHLVARAAHGIGRRGPLRILPCPASRSRAAFRMYHRWIITQLNLRDDHHLHSPRIRCPLARSAHMGAIPRSRRAVPRDSIRR